MRSLVVLFFLLFAVFLGSWTYKIKTPIDRPDEYAEGYDPQAGSWWDANAVETDDSWRLDPEIPLNYLPVQGEEELYMVIDNNGNVIGYRHREKQIDGSWKWETVDPNLPEGYEPVEGLENVYKVTDADGNVSYKKYIRNKDGTYAFVDVDENGRRIGQDRDATRIDGKHVHVSGNLYTVLNDDGVVIGYDKRMETEDGSLVWMETDMEGFGSLSDMGEFNFDGFDVEDAAGGGIQPTMSGNELDGAAQAMADANAAASAGGVGDVSINIDPSAFQAEYGNGYGDGYDDGYLDGAKDGAAMGQGQGGLLQPQSEMSLPSQGGVDSSALPSFDFEGFGFGSDTPTNEDLGVSNPLETETGLEELEKTPQERAAETGSNVDPNAVFGGGASNSTGTADIVDAPGRHTETKVVQEKRNVNGVITTYETRVTNVYDDDGVLIETKSDGPYVVNDQQRVSDDGVVAQVMNGNKESTLQGEFSRTSGYFTFLTDVESGMAAKLNAQRSSNGSSSLVVDQEATLVAKLRAADMAAHSADGSSSFSYGPITSMLDEYGVSYSTAAENTWKTLSGTADDVHTRFQALDDSRATRTSGEYSRYGAGVVERDGTYYVCEVFIG